ncbi:MAG: adenine-specific methyltransferase EcoRI family protein [Paludibacteraceae bacterium]|nr:adenine-specific methyltransferase EcoRI family protein [Paludibacteraceae bacterium]
MAKNTNLGAAKTAKNDEFYTQYADIQKEVNAYIEYNPDVFRGKTVLLPCDDPEWSNFTKFFAQNFEFFGLKKLISTSYAIESKKYQTDWQPTLFETENPLYNVEKSRVKGKIFTLTHDTNHNGRIDINDLQWQYLEGDGDFRSAEVTALRDEADIIVTNPPFSLFREFLAWIMEGQKQFLIIGNKNCITYKEVFPLIKNNKIWIGPSITGGDREFRIPKEYITHSSSLRTDEKGNKYLRVPGVHWFTNLDHGRRHKPLLLMTMADNIRFSRHKEIKDIGYQHYDNYDAIEVPYTDAIPSDYEGVMGVPISFMDKYCPEQFEIIWRGGDIDFAENICDFYTPPTDEETEIYKKQDKTWRIQNPYLVDEQGKAQVVYQRVFIRKKQ